MKERNAAMVAAGATAFLLAVADYLLGEWGFWVLVVVLVPLAGFGLISDPDRKNR